MHAHRPALIPLHQEVQIASLAFIADGCIRPYHGFLHLGPFIFRDQGGSDLHAGDVVAVGEGEAHPLGIVADLLHGLEFQGEESLVAAREGFVRTRAHRLGGLLLCSRGDRAGLRRTWYLGGVGAVGVVPPASDSCGSQGVEEGG